MKQALLKRIPLLFFMICMCLRAQSQTAQWAITAGGSGSDLFTSIAQDPSGNIIGAADHQGGFSLGSVTYNLMGNVNRDILLAKFNSSGTLLWNKYFYGPGQSTIQKVVCDAQGNIYVSGYFVDSLVMDQVTIYTQAVFINPETDAFIAKLSPSGTVLWARPVRGAMGSEEFITSMAISPSTKNIYVSGTFYGSISNGNSTITGTVSNMAEGFYLKLDTAGNITRLAAIGSPGFVSDITVDLNENIYVLGTHAQAVSTATISLPGAGLFVLKTDSAFNPLMAKNVFTPSASGTNVGSIYQPSRLRTDRWENIYLTALVAQSATLNGTSTTFTNTSSTSNQWDGLLVKLNNAGTPVRGLQFSGNNHDVAKSIHIDPYDSLYVVGWYYSSNFSIGSRTFSNAGQDDAFVISLDTAFNIGRSFSLGGSSYEAVSEVLVDSNMNLYLAGLASGSFSLGNNVNINTANNWDMLLARYTIPNPPVLPCSLVVNLGPDTGYCNSFSRVLAIANPPAGTSFLWSTNDTTPAINVNQPGSYWVRASHPLCLKSDTIQISVDQTLPSYTSLHDTTLCHTQPIYLSRPSNNARFTRWWNNSSANTIIAAPTLNHAWIEYKNYCGTIRDSMLITRTQLATVNLGPDTTLCSHQQISLQAANPGYRYHWSTGDSSQTIQAANAAAYWVEVSNYCGAVIDSIVINKLPNPTVHLGADTFICGNGSITLQGQTSHASNLLWSNNASSNSIHISQPGLYTLTASNRCASSSDSIYVSKLSIPQVSISGNNYVCTGAQSSLQALANEKVIWSTLDTTNTIIIQQPGKYRVSSANRCGTATDSIQVDARHAPEPKLGNDSTFCNHINITLYANTAASYYTWSSGAKGNNVIGIPVFNPGWYWVDASNMCGTARDSMLITKGTLPAVNLGNDTLVKPGFSITLDAGSSGQKYRWSRSTADTLRFLTTSSSGIYWVDVSNVCGTRRDSIHIMLNTYSRQPGAPFQFSVFPNPGSHEIKLSTHKGAQLQSLSIVDIMGRTLLQQQNPDASSGLISLDVSGLANGNYWLHIVHSEGLSIIRFSIDR